MAASININGVTITGSRSVQISNGKIIVDGKEVNTGDAKQIKIEINGDIRELHADAVETVTVKGKAFNVKTLSGDIEIGGDVDGNVSSMSGSIHVGGAVRGSVSTMSGNVRHR